MAQNAIFEDFATRSHNKVNKRMNSEQKLLWFIVARTQSNGRSKPLKIQRRLHGAFCVGRDTRPGGEVVGNELAGVALVMFTFNFHRRSVTASPQK